MQTLKTVILALVLIAGVNYASAVDWTPPTATPPAGNTPAPLNVTNIGQVKDGGLVLNAARTAPIALQVMNTASVNGLVVQSNGQVGIGNLPNNASLDIFGNIRIRGGTPAEGKVLTSDASGLGTWQTPTTGGSGGGISGGVANQVPKFSSATTLTNSAITENNSQQVGINVTSPTSRLDVNGNVTIRGNGAGFLPAAGKVLTATNSTGLAAWQTGVEVGAVRKAAGITQICSLTPNKRFLATVSGSFSYAGVITGYTITATVNGVTGSLIVYPVATASGNPGATYVGTPSIPLAVTSDSSGCVQVTNTNMTDFHLSVVG